jgi:excisionase family DNA binding protein
MKTTKEAADSLGISPRRVVALIQSGSIKAEKVGGIWLIDEFDLEHRQRTVQKSGGRPRKGSRSSETRYILKNRTYDIAELVYDSGLKEFTSISLVDIKRAPIGLANSRSQISLPIFNSWWRNRGIPADRPALATVLANEGIFIPFELAVRNLGLSLSDQFWINPENSSLSWAAVNFFNNNFETLAIIGENDHSVRHPDNTSDGVLPKHWVIRNKERRLLKGSRFLMQEPYNEVVATKLYKRLLRPSDFVSYKLAKFKGITVSSCPLFLDDDEEFVPAEYVMRIQTQQKHHNEYQHYIECCHSLGVPDVELSLAQMIIGDDILANTDRHYRNFGIIRNVETLNCRPAPLFDSGTSLWCTKPIEELRIQNFDFTSRPFRPEPSKQLSLVTDFSWIKADSLAGFPAEALGVLSKNDALADRLPYLETALEHRVERVRILAEYL